MPCPAPKRGLFVEVQTILDGLSNIDAVTYGKTVRGYRGYPKVKIPERWSPARQLPIVVCDVDYGERRIVVMTSKTGAIARILRRELSNQGYTVC